MYLQVVYGDTDSVMVNFGVPTVAEVNIHAVLLCEHTVFVFNCTLVTFVDGPLSSAESIMRPFHYLLFCSGLLQFAINLGDAYSDESCCGSISNISKTNQT